MGKDKNDKSSKVGVKAFNVSVWDISGTPVPRSVVRDVTRAIEKIIERQPGLAIQVVEDEDA